MTYYQISDMIQSAMEGAVVFNQNRFDEGYISSILDAARALWIADNYQKDKFIPAVCYQKFYPEYSVYVQPADGCFAKFRMPDVIRLDSNSDGIRYVGSDDYNSGATNGFVRVRSRAWKSTLSKHPIMNPSGYFSFLYDGRSQMLELYGKAQPVRRVLVEALFKHPLLIPTYNKDMDEYPLSDDGIAAVQKMIIAGDIRLTEMTTPKPAFVPQGGKV